MPLTQPQRNLLSLLDRPDEELTEIGTLIARYYADKATAAFEAFAEEKGLSVEETDQWAYDHYRASTDRPGASGDGV